MKNVPLSESAEADDLRLDGASLDISTEKRRALLGLFPEAHSEGGAINFAQLRRALGDAVDPGKERFGLTWPGKAACFKAIQTPSMATLLPAPEKSVDFDATGNVIIEGDNLEVLKLLQKSYLSKIKMIYIDPPYNTGNDFIYPDNYSESLQTYLRYTGQLDADGKRFSNNSDADGRFHSKWLSMIYPRLYLARNLLRNDGVLLVSINDVELSRLLDICNELFGESNHLATFVWVNEGNIDNQSKFKTNHEYVVAFAKDEESFAAPSVIDPNIAPESKLYRDFIENSIVKNGPANPISNIDLPIGFPANFDAGIIQPQENFWPKLSNTVEVVDRKTVKMVTVQSGWSSRDLLLSFIENGCQPVPDAKGQSSTFYITDSGSIIGRKVRSDKQSHVLTVLRGMGTVRQSSVALAERGITFSYPKPLGLMDYLVRVGSEPDDVILDFFAGSGTTGESAVKLGRRFILVQLPEPTGDDSGSSIADIAQKRIRAIEQRITLDAPSDSLIAPNKEAKIDVGFRVFKLAESNVREWDVSAPTDATSLNAQLTLGADHLRSDRTELDVVYEVLLKSGYTLSETVKSGTITGHTVYSVADGAFLICLERSLTLDLIRALAERKPERVLLLDGGFAGNDQLKTNAAQTFKDKNIVFRTL